MKVEFEMAVVKLKDQGNVALKNMEDAHAQHEKTSMKRRSKNFHALWRKQSLQWEIPIASKLMS